MKSSHTNYIILSRLLKYKDPFKSIGLKVSDFRGKEVEPVEAYVDEKKREYDEDWVEWHKGRVIYFKARFENNLTVDPIIVFNEDKYGNKKNKFPSVFDGFHRVCGAILAGKKRIEAENHSAYAWDWLVGDTNKDPIEALIREDGLKKKRRA